jgi:hypothetical protein
MKVSDLFEATKKPDGHFPAEIAGDIQRAVAKSELEYAPKFKAPDAEGWFQLRNTSLGADERSDEGLSRKSTIAGILKKHGFEVDWTGGNVFKARKKKSINEGYKGDWAILPATMELYNKRTVDIITAASTWDEATILVCENEQGRICFVSSAGGKSSFDHHKDEIGKSFSTHHDQTGASKGMYKVLNVVWVKGKEIVNKVNETGIKGKASLAVFK